MKASYILLMLLMVALVSGCVDKKEQNLSNTSANLSNTSTGEIIPESYVSEVEGNLTHIESMINEKEESFSTEISDSVFS